MNTESNALGGLPLEERVAPGRMAATHPFLWSVRRELWEYKSIYIAPLAVAGVTLLGYLFASMGYALSSQDMARRRSALTEPYHFAMALIMGAAFLVGLFYCLDALHGERRDRSILFWKSLPVSDLVTVLAKATIPFVVLPLLAYVITLGVHFIMLLLSTAVLAGSGLNTATLWSEAWNSDVGLLYHLVTVHVLWYAPTYAWLLLVSGWAKRAAFLWAVLPALAIFGIETIAFHTRHFANLVQYRFTGPQEFDMGGTGSHTAHAVAHSGLAQFLLTPGLWNGLILAAIFLWLAVRLRRSQGPL
ncbi:MAG: ABC transporter permease [Candidatus Sulfotelmatobacter sp.]